MSERRTIKYNMRLLSDTIFGSGYSVPGGTDISVFRDREGYPMLKGSTMKGLLRESAANIADWNGLGRDKVVSLFGTEDRGGAMDEHRLNFTAAVIGDRKTMPEDCFVERAFTAIGGNGIARDGSLRLAECVKAGYVFSGTIECHKSDVEFIEEALDGIKWVGTLRNRGFGHVRIDYEEETAVSCGVKLDTNTIYYRIKLESPLIMTNKQRSFMNTYCTDRYIKGSAIRGMVMGKLSQAEPEWFGEHKTQLLSEDTRFFDALLYLGGVSLPPIKGFYENKDGSDFQTVLANEGKLSPGVKRAALGDAVTLNDGRITYSTVETGQAARIKKAGRNTDDDKMMFQNQYIEAGQEFEGYICTRDNELARRIADVLDGTVWLGADRYEGYGRCSVTVKQCEQPAWMDRYGYREGDTADSTIYMLALSPFTMMNEAGEPVGLDCKKIGGMLELKAPEKLQIELCSTSVSEYGGYNVTWGCSLPLVRMYDMGSIFRLSMDEVPAVHSLRKLEQSGIGVRRAEGFGNILFIRKDIFESITGKEKYSATESAEGGHGRKPVDLAQIRRNRCVWIMDTAQKELIAPSGGPSASQIGGLQALLEGMIGRINNSGLTSEKCREEIERFLKKADDRQQDKQKYSRIEKICMNVLDGGADDKLAKADDVERLKLLCELFDYSRKIDTEV